MGQNNRNGNRRRRRETNFEHIDSDQRSGLRVGLPLEGSRSGRVGSESESGKGIHLAKREVRRLVRERRDARRKKNKSTNDQVDPKKLDGSQDGGLLGRRDGGDCKRESDQQSNIKRWDEDASERKETN